MDINHIVIKIMVKQWTWGVTRAYRPSYQ